MTLTHLAPPATAPALHQRTGGDWSARALCALPHTNGLDLAQMTTEAEQTQILGSYTVTTRAGTDLRCWDDDLAEARVMCSACPVLVTCRARALLDVDVAGVAAGLTETERARWRRRHRIRVRQLRVAVLVVDDSGQLVLDLSTETRASGQRSEITGEELVAIARLTAAGWTAADIADRLVTRRAAPAGGGWEDVAWTVGRVNHAREILLGRGKAGRRSA